MFSDPNSDRKQSFQQMNKQFPLQVTQSGIRALPNITPNDNHLGNKTSRKKPKLATRSPGSGPRTVLGLCGPPKVVARLVPLSSSQKGKRALTTQKNFKDKKMRGKMLWNVSSTNTAHYY